MNAHLVPAVLLMAAIALSWPEFVAMFRLDGRVAVIEVSLISVATAASRGTIALTMPQRVLLKHRGCTGKPARPTTATPGPATQR